MAPRGAAAALDGGTSVDFCSSSAPSAAIYLPPFRQDRPFAYGRHGPPLGTAGNVSSRAKLTPVNVQRIYAESQVKWLQ